MPHTGRTRAIRVAIFIDGSNLIAALDRAGLGYPALAPLIEEIRQKDELVLARFYACPPPKEPWKSRFLAMQHANRHIKGLEFFQGYRNAAGHEKVVDVALAVDLIYGVSHNCFDRADIIGGDGDHLYAIKIAHATLGNHLRVHLAPGQYLSELGKERIPFTRWTEEKYVQAGIVDRGQGIPVPLAASAPIAVPWETPILTGAFGKASVPPIEETRFIGKPEIKPAPPHDEPPTPS